MRIALLFLACFLCFQGSQSLFYGANVQLSQATALSSTLNQCSTTADITIQKLCQISKKLLKFVHPNFQTLANFVTDIQYVFQSVKEFYTYFLTCLNDQSQQTTADVSIRNLRVLIYQLNNYVITGFSNNFMNSAPAFGAALGGTYNANVAALATLLRNQFTAVAVALADLAVAFDAIAASGQPITAVSLNATLNSAPFTTMLTALRDICSAEASFSTMLDGIWTSVSGLESILISVDISQSGSGTLISQAQFYLDTANQAAKKAFADKIASYLFTIDSSVAQYIALAGRLFVGDADVIAYRQVLETYVGSLRLFLDNTNNAFALLLTNNMRSLVGTTSSLKNLVSQLGTVVKLNLETMVATSGSSIGTCFISNTPFVSGLSTDLGFNASQCISSQTTVSTQAASLLSFIVEDVVIEALGVIDRMCQCAVAGDPITVRRSKFCMQTVSAELVTPTTGILALETAYLQAEFAGVQAALATALGTLNTCIQTAIGNFGTSYGSFTSKFQICMVG